ncbi:hypothetical protein [Tannockella kyphosi]|uniref:hypothetical protein n=1 Tax=Tannockella kyphosi TaxID=2899121 RepID=UPI002012E571|nr:hypothetical protein [Tannockella kyphosi]
MEGITQIEKTEEDVQRCKEIVKQVITQDLGEDVLIGLTKDIMDTALFIGGDFEDDNILNLAKQYVDMGGVERFLKNFK